MTNIKTINKDRHVYRFLDIDNIILYVGSTKRMIKERMREHDGEHSHLAKECYEKRVRTEHFIIPSIGDMYLYEMYFIHLWKPYYNTKHKYVEDAESIFEISKKAEPEWKLYVPPVKKDRRKKVKKSKSKEEYRSPFEWTRPVILAEKKKPVATKPFPEKPESSAFPTSQKRLLTGIKQLQEQIEGCQNELKAGVAAKPLLVDFIASLKVAQAKACPYEELWNSNDANDFESFSFNFKDKSLMSWFNNGLEITHSSSSWQHFTTGVTYYDPSEENPYTIEIRRKYFPYLSLSAMTIDSKLAVKTSELNSAKVKLENYQNKLKIIQSESNGATNIDIKIELKDMTREMMILSNIKRVEERIAEHKKILNAAEKAKVILKDFIDMLNVKQEMNPNSEDLSYVENQNDYIDFKVNIKDELIWSWFCTGLCACKKERKWRGPGMRTYKQQWLTAKYPICDKDGNREFYIYREYLQYLSLAWNNIDDEMEKHSKSLKSDISKLEAYQTLTPDVMKCA